MASRSESELGDDSGGMQRLKQRQQSKLSEVHVVPPCAFTSPGCQGQAASRPDTAARGT